MIGEEDEDIKEGIEEYEKALNLSSTAHAYYNASRAVYDIGEDLRFFNDRRRKLSENIKLKSKKIEAPDILEEERQVLEHEVDSNINSLMKMTENILSLTSKLEGAFDNLEKLNEKLAADKDSGKAIRGGGEIGRREE